MKRYLFSAMIYGGLTLSSLGALSIPIISGIISFQKVGHIHDFVFYPHWTMLISLGAIVLGFVFLFLGMFFKE